MFLTFSLYIIISKLKKVKQNTINMIMQIGEVKKNCSDINFKTHHDVNFMLKV